MADSLSDAEREAMVEAMETAWPHLVGCWSSVDLGDANRRHAETMFRAGLAARPLPEGSQGEDG